jgi:hypothetical protein
MSTTERPLAPYEERLLVELRDVVTDRAAATRAPARTRTARRRLPIAVGLGAAAALAVAAGIGAPALLGAGDRPAYAAERDPDGSIRIHIREYRDAKGLQARLSQLGVAAVVDYVPNGKQCREPRATYVPDDQVPRGLLTDSPHDDGKGAYWKLHPDLIGPGQTFVYTTTIIGDPDDAEWSAKADIRLATGPVGACELVPGPVLPRNGG